MRVCRSHCTLTKYSDQINSILIPYDYFRFRALFQRRSQFFFSSRLLFAMSIKLTPNFNTFDLSLPKGFNMGKYPLANDAFNSVDPFLRSIRTNIEKKKMIIFWRKKKIDVILISSSRFATIFKSNKMNYRKYDDIWVIYGQMNKRIISLQKSNEWNHNFIY